MRVRITQGRPLTAPGAAALRRCGAAALLAGGWGQDLSSGRDNVTVPVDLAAGLLAPAYAAGVRIHRCRPAYT